MKPLQIVAVLTACFVTATFSTILPLSAQNHFQKTYSWGSQPEQLNTVYVNNDGSYSLAGFTKNYGSGNRDILLLTIDGSGVVTEKKTFGTSSKENVNSIVTNNDSTFTLGGFTEGNTAGYQDFKMLNVASDFSTVHWDITIGGSYKEFGGEIIPTLDGGYLGTGRAGTYQFWDQYAYKVDANGNLEWTKTFGGSSPDHGFSVVQTADSGFAFTGLNTSYAAYNGDLQLIRTDKTAMYCGLRSITLPLMIGDAPCCKRQILALSLPASLQIRKMALPMVTSRL